MFRGPFNFLSNYELFPHPILFKGISIPSVEHGYQMCKTPDDKDRLEISKHPLKGLKRFTKTFEFRSDWDQVKLSIMYSLLILKYSIPVFRTSLLNTGNAILVEGNTWHDNFWGVEIDEEHSMTVDDAIPFCSPLCPSNHLGRMLMNIRDRIRCEDGIVNVETTNVDGVLHNIKREKT